MKKKRLQSLLDKERTVKIEFIKSIFYNSSLPKIKSLIAVVLSTFTLLSNAKNLSGVSESTDPKLNPNSATFIENKGQVRDQNQKERSDVLFSGAARGMVYHLRNNGISYQLHRKTEKQSEIYRLDVNWLNINSVNNIEKDEALPGYDNFYKGNTPVLEVKTYNGVTYKNIYNNIDLHYYEKSGDLKYDYIVAPSADYKQIQIEINGAEKIVTQPDGGLLLKTPFGDILEGAPLVYQNGKKLNAKWNVSHNILSFDIDNYNPLLPLIIDPITRTWGTYYGAGNLVAIGTEANGCNTDANGNVYFVGITDASAGTGIATIGSHQAAFGGGFSDGFLVKFNNAGIRQWGTYYGGTGGSFFNYSSFSNCALDVNGNIYVVGTSDTPNGISTPGAHQAVLSGNKDAVLVKFNNGGVRLWGTYYGGIKNDEFLNVGIDVGGDVYCTGATLSSTGISTSGSHQSVFGGGGNFDYDAMLVKFNSNGARQWGTYYGDTGNDWGYAIAIDASTNIYLGGLAESLTGIATVGSHQAAFSGGFSDAFLAKFNNNGVRQWGTYYGGSALDYFTDMATDSNGNIYATGVTDSNSGISSPGSHLTTFGGGFQDAFLVKINTSGIRQWGTYFGGSGDDQAFACSTDPLGNVIIVGETSSTSGISTSGNHQAVFGGTNDAFIAKFNNAGTQQRGSYYGGASRDVAKGCAVDNTGTNIFMCGTTNSNDGTSIASAGSHQPSMATLVDAFLVLFSDCIVPNAPANTTAVSNLKVCRNSSTTLSATASGPINWFNAPTSTVVLQTGGAFNTPTLTTGTYTFFAQTTNTCSASLRTAIIVTVNACTGFSEISVADFNINIVPNPNNGHFNITTSPFIENGMIEIYNSLGQLILKQKVETNGNKVYLMEKSPGIYQVRLIENNRIIGTSRIIKE